MAVTLDQKIKSAIRDVPDFPKPGIIFKDITPILKDAQLCAEMVDEMVRQLQGVRIDAIAAIESRGFLFGMLLAQKLKVPFVPVRKQGKLPHKTISHTYELEYATATVEVHEDAIKKGDRVLIHDDLLATGGTVSAASELILKLGGEVSAYSFIVSLSFLNGRAKICKYSDKICTLAAL